MGNQVSLIDKCPLFVNSRHVLCPWMWSKCFHYNALHLTVH